MTAFGEFIRHARAKQGMTQAQLGAAIGMEAAQLSKWERGELQRPSPEFAQTLAAALGVAHTEMGLALLGFFPPAYATNEQMRLDFPLDLTAEEWQAIAGYARQLRLGREDAQPPRRQRPRAFRTER